MRFNKIAWAEQNMLLLIASHRATRFYQEGDMAEQTAEIAKTPIFVERPESDEDGSILLRERAPTPARNAPRFRNRGTGQWGKECVGY